MRRFKRLRQSQRFVTVQSAVSNLFNPGRHLLAATSYRLLRHRAFASRDAATGA
jgi:putative transposase